MDIDRLHRYVCDRNCVLDVLALNKVELVGEGIVRGRFCGLETAKH
jgi:hypothetical protein